MVQTVIGINFAMMRTPEKNRPKTDYDKELPAEQITKIAKWCCAKNGK